MFPLLVREHSGFDYETDTHGNFQTKAGTATLRHINGKLGVLPIVKLVFTHVKITVVDGPQPHIGLIEHQLPFWEAHGRGTIATASALVKHELAMFFP